VPALPPKPRKPTEAPTDTLDELDTLFSTAVVTEFPMDSSVAFVQV
jgi:hypothetical protein